MKSVKIALIGLALFTGLSLFAQNPPHPPSGGHGQSGNQPMGGGAPIGEGMIIMISLAVAYGAKKLSAIQENGNKMVE